MMKLTLKNISKLYSKMFDRYLKDYSYTFALMLMQEFENRFWSMISQNINLTKISKHDINILSGKLLPIMH